MAMKYLLFKKDHKFLGSLITLHIKDYDIFVYIWDMIKEGLSNIENTHIRNEYKLKIYSRYFLPSLRFHLTVNDMSQCHLDELDSITSRTIKKWAGLPHPGTVAFLYMPEGLGINSISDMYLEGHALAHISTRIKGDDDVNRCLDSRLDRESQWTRKHSQIVQSEALYATSTHNQDSVSLTSTKNTTKKTIKEMTSNLWFNHVKDLTVQGRFLELCPQRIIVPIGKGSYIISP